MVIHPLQSKSKIWFDTIWIERRLIKEDTSFDIKFFGVIHLMKHQPTSISYYRIIIFAIPHIICSCGSTRALSCRIGIIMVISNTLEIASFCIKFQWKFFIPISTYQGVAAVLYTSPTYSGSKCADIVTQFWI